MPVSLDRLIEQVEPFVINERLIRECIQIPAGDGETQEEKKQTMPMLQVESLSFSFKALNKISNLKCLDNLVKLQLDNNQIAKIEKLDHLVNLTWLDLSFNKITRIEGLSTLVKLTDLSLFSNAISEIENLDTLTSLHVLSLGNNSIKRLDNVMYLRQFKNLRLVNLAGNPICKEHDYRSYVLSHVLELTYLDYRRVKAADVTLALEQHQDEMIEIREKEDREEEEDVKAKAKAKHMQEMREANLEGIESMLEDVHAKDEEWQRISQVPGLTDEWPNLKENFKMKVEDFRAAVLEESKLKKSEYQEFRSVLQAALDDKDSRARDLIREFEKEKGRVLRSKEAQADISAAVSDVKAKLGRLKGLLMEMEVDASEMVAELCRDFDRAYTEIVERNKGNYNNFFGLVRELNNNFFNTLQSMAASTYDRYAADTAEVDSFPEEVRMLLSDKDSLVNAVQASQDMHTNFIDALEDKLVSKEVRGANDLAAQNANWQAERNRERISEIIAYVQRNMVELDELEGEAEDNADN